MTEVKRPVTTSVETVVQSEGQRMSHLVVRDGRLESSSFFRRRTDVRRSDARAKVSRSDEKHDRSDREATAFDKIVEDAGVIVHRPSTLLRQSNVSLFLRVPRTGVRQVPDGRWASLLARVPATSNRQFSRCAARVHRRRKPRANY